MSLEEEENPEAGKRKITGEEKKVFKETESRIRHIGYVIFFGLGALIFFPMIIGAIQGIRHDQVWDPFTELPVSTEEAVLDCREEAADLIFLAGDTGEFDEQRFRRWVSRCQQDHLELFDLLDLTRNRLRGGHDLPQMGIDNDHDLMVE